MKLLFFSYFFFFFLESFLNSNIIFKSMFFELIQGFLELFPVSSSLFLDLIGGKDYSWIHCGTAIGLIVFFFSFFLEEAKKLIFFNKNNNYKIILFFILSNIPIVSIGLIFKILNINIQTVINNLSISIYGNYFKYYKFINGFVFSLLLYLSSFFKVKREELNYLDGIFVGIAQIFALLPGVSRLGICITVLKINGLSMFESYFFGLLCGIPSLIGSCFFGNYQIIGLIRVAILTIIFLPFSIKYWEKINIICGFRLFLIIFAIIYSFY